FVVLRRTVHDETALRLHRAADEYGAVQAGAIREWDGKLAEHLGERQVAGAVHDDAKSALGVVLADIGDRLAEIRVGHRGHRDQEMILQRPQAQALALWG